MTTALTPTAHRVHLGVLLRNHRDQAGLDTKQVAKALGWYDSKVSRVETGMRTVVAAELDRLLDLYRVGPDDAEGLRRLGAKARKRGPVGPLPQRAHTFVAVESIADDLAYYTEEAIPPPAQTEAYARAQVRASSVDLSPAEVELLVAVRMQRGRRLAEDVDVRPATGVGATPMAPVDVVDHVAAATKRGRAESGAPGHLAAEVDMSRTHIDTDGTAGTSANDFADPTSTGVDGDSGSVRSDRTTERTSAGQPDAGDVDSSSEPPDKARSGGTRGVDVVDADGKGSQQQVARAHFVLSEAALRRPVGGPRAFSEQLRHLRTLADLPNVRLQVLAAAGEHVALGMSFQIARLTQARADFVYLDGLTDGTYLNEQADTAPYLRVFDRVSNDALPERESARLIEHYLAGL